MPSNGPGTRNSSRPFTPHKKTEPFNLNNNKFLEQAFDHMCKDRILETENSDIQDEPMVMSVKMDRGSSGDNTSELIRDLMQP